MKSVSESKWFVPVIAAFAALAAAACSTVAGAGEDISKGGDAITGTAQQTEREMSK